MKLVDRLDGHDIAERESEQRLAPARSCLADSLRVKPRAAMASSTARRVGSATMSGRLSTLETVPTATPARAATSFTLGRLAATSILPGRRD